MLCKKKTKLNLAILLMAAVVVGLTMTGWAKKPEKPPGGGGGKEARYTIVDLGNFGGWGGYALSINESSQVVGYSYYPDYLHRAFLVTPEYDIDGNPVWFRDDDGDGINDLMLDLGTLGLGNGSNAWSMACGINDLGQVVGYSVTDDSVGDTPFYLFRPFLISPEDTDGDSVPDTWFRDGGGGVNALMIDLGRIGGDWSTPGSCGRAYDISNSGHVVGYISATDNVSAGRAFVIAPEDTDSDGVPDTWFRDDDDDGYNDLMLDLGTLRAGSSQAWSQAWGVNDSGQVVGKSFGDYVNNERWYQDRGFLITPEYDINGNPVWFRDDGPGSNALMIELGPLSGADTCSAEAINSSGQVVGRSSDNRGSQHAVLWDVDELGNVTLTDLGKVKGKQHTYACGINDAGQVVGRGFSYGGRDSSGRYTAFLWENGTMTKLIDLLANSEGISDLGALGINESGEIVGTIRGDGYEHAYIALPIPAAQ
ncbi:MAG: DUF3466 family protein [Planctomycetota bacterium]|jgi:probable HAF family extracellular repeat protein